MLTTSRKRASTGPGAVLVLALLLPLPASTQEGGALGPPKDGTWNRRVEGGGDYQEVVEVSGRVEVAKFLVPPSDPCPSRPCAR